MAITLRLTKGSQLTYSELDNNFKYLTANLFNNYANIGNQGTTETDLDSYTVIANQLANNGEKITAEYGGSITENYDLVLKVYFAGTVIYNSGTNGSENSDWIVDVSIIRTSATSVRYRVKVMDSDAASFANYVSVGELTGLNLSSNNVLKITGTASGAGAGTNNIVLKSSTAEWKPTVI